jgi:hypothetical protein
MALRFLEVSPMTPTNPKGLSLGIAVVMVAASLVGGAAEGATSANKPVLVRRGAFSVSLVEHGRRVGMFTCFLRATQYQRGFKIEAWPLRGWLELPRGRWSLAYAIRARQLPPEGSGGGDHVNLARPGKAVILASGGVSDGIDSGRIGPRIACGVLAFPPGHAYRPRRRLFATVAWPSFKLLGANIPVDASQPGGGVG